MRKLIVSTFVSLDGVLQAPGGPDEDPTGGFDLGGWTFPFWDGSDAMDRNTSAAGFDGAGRELLLGRRTYEIFEAYWPYQPAGDPLAKTLNEARKHVASRSLTGPLAWHNSTLLQGDVGTAVARLKAEDGPPLQVIGSGHLVQTLQGAELVDEYNVFTFPVLLGRGKRLFEAGARPGALKLVRSETAPSGVVMSTYTPAGALALGSFEQAAPSDKERARRARWARESG